MAGQVEAAAEKLRAYLRELKPGARALLIAELERGLLHGTSPAGAELVLSELRRSLREGQSKSARFGDPARLFFQPLEPFLVDVLRKLLDERLQKIKSLKSELG